MNTPNYLRNLFQEATTNELQWKAIAGAGSAVLNSILGIGALTITWAILGLWFADMFFGVASAVKRGGFRALAATRAMDGLLKGSAIFGLAAVGHLMEIAIRPEGTESEAGIAASIVLGVAAMSLFLSIGPNITLFWADAAKAINRVKGVIGAEKDEEGRE